MPQITAPAKSQVIDVGGPPPVCPRPSTVVAGSDPTSAFGLFHPHAGGYAYAPIP
ncbi:hypothetical protein [Mycobacterium ostraviense]|uniref:hypothetical protein n=1 Tax=Mycobacterium ostraviense TaxID=2738409 RepID=UPI000A4C8168|nr:hypothetical protein [Mycobacterium ostraviense]UGT90646.1 hypothetical protein LTS72_20520 [Mycobacterium ostraviense]